MRIARELYDQLIAHARADAPNECCGMVAELDGRAVAVHPVENSAASPLRYVMHGKQQLAVMNAIEDAGYEIGAIYHSHTRTVPEPSQTDINLASLWPGTPCMIIGLAGAEGEIRMWRIDGNEVSEAELIVEG